MHLQDRLAPSGLELIERPSGGGRFLRSRRRKDLHYRWLRAPVLYLDAAGTGSLEIAKAWLPAIELAVEARAKPVHTRATQIVDSQVSYTRIATGDTAETLARIIEAQGQNGLVVCPKQLRDEWDRAKRLPGWELWNFGAIRGRDEGRSVRRLIVISRQLPDHRVVEIQAETIFGRAVERLAPGRRYSKVPVGRLMSDGTGRRALAYRHPDTVVEAVRFAICEGELLQAIGRGRGARRTEETPLEVLVLTDVPLPLPINEITTLEGTRRWRGTDRDAC